MPFASALQISAKAKPRRVLPLAVFVFYALAFLLHPYSPLATGHLEDPDDYMRLVQVTNWLDGQGWYDLGQPRMSPGAHTVVHWARLVDLPIAALMLAFKPWLGMQGAALLAAMFVPPVLFGALLLLVCALARPFTGAGRADLAGVLTLFAPALLFNFTPGRVDHHAYQILIAGFGLLCFEKITGDEKAWRAALCAAIAFAAGLWIGTEALPWLILFVACLAIAAAWQGGVVLRNAAIFGFALLAATLVVLPLALPPEQWNSRALSWFSIGDVIFAALVAVMFSIDWCVGRNLSCRYARLGLFILTGASAAGLFVYLVPDALIGPFADYENFNATVALDNIGEAVPLRTAFHLDVHSSASWFQAFTVFTNFLFLPLLALGGLIWIGKTEPRQRSLCLAHGVFLLGALLLTWFWQIRVGWFMQLFTLAPLTGLGWMAWDRIALRWQGRRRFWAEIAVFLVIGPLPAVLLPAIYGHKPFYPDIVLFPVDRSGPVCPLEKVTRFLDWKYSGRPYVIMAGMNEGPQLLFATPHRVIGGNYNVPGNPDVLDFFRARDDAAAQAIARKWKVDLVLTCRSVSAFYAGLDHPQLGRTAFIEPVKDHKLRLVSSLGRPTLVERLVAGQVPAWLKPVEIPGESDYFLYEAQLPPAMNP